MKEHAARARGRSMYGHACAATRCMGGHVLVRQLEEDGPEEVELFPAQEVHYIHTLITVMLSTHT